MNNHIKEDLQVKNPWLKPIGNITWGFIFTIMTFNFYKLNYMLPIIGVALLFLGFYDLRKINKTLQIVWKFSILNLILNILSLIYTITPLHINYSNMTLTVIFNMVFQITFLLIFRSGIKEVYKNANLTLERDSILRLVILRVLIVILAWTQLGSIWFIFLPFVIYYFANFRGLYNISEQLKDVPIEEIQPRNKYRNRKCWITYLLGCTFIIVICTSFSNHIKLISTEFNSPEVTETRKNLQTLGFPKEILKDIPEAQVELLKAAERIEVYRELIMFDPKEEAIKTTGNGYTVNTTKEIPGRTNLKATSVYVQLKDSRMYGVHYFQWIDGGAYWNDGFNLSGSVPLELIAGNLLYEKDGIDYSAKIPRLNTNIVLEMDLYSYGNREEKITGAVSYPFGSKEQRGYILYEFKFNKELKYGEILNGGIILKYIHNQHPILLPYEEVEYKNLMFSDIQKTFYTNFSRNLSD